MASDARDALSALCLFRHVGTLHLSSFPTLSNGSDIALSATTNVHAVFVRNPWPMQGTFAALAHGLHPHLTSLDVGDPWHKSIVQEAGPAQALSEDDTIDPHVLTSLRTLLSTLGYRLKHLGLGAMTLGCPIFYAGSSEERVIHDVVFVRCPELQSFAINVAISACRPERTQAMLQQTTRVLESMSRSIEDFTSLHALTLNFELATLGSIHVQSGHTYLMYDLDAYKPLWIRMDGALVGISAVLDVFFEAVESEPCGLDVGDMKDVYFPAVLPVSWAKMKSVSRTSNWAMQRRLSMA